MKTKIENERYKKKLIVLFNTMIEHPSGGDTRIISYVAGFKVKELYFDYYSALTGRLKINKLLSLLDLMPRVLKIPFAWAFWFIGKKSQKR